MNYRAVIATFVLLVASVAALGQQASDTDFTVADIKIEGLQRISEGTVFNYLPVNIGDPLNAQRLREALRALYATGFFRDVVLSRDGNTLLITVLVAESPLLGAAPEQLRRALAFATALNARQELPILGPFFSGCLASTFLGSGCLASTFLGSGCGGGCCVNRTVISDVRSIAWPPTVPRLP